MVEVVPFPSEKNATAKILLDAIDEVRRQVADGHVDGFAFVALRANKTTIFAHAAEPGALRVRYALVGALHREANRIIEILEDMGDTDTVEFHRDDPE